MLLLFPQPVLQHLVVRRIDRPACLRGILAAYLLGEFPVFGLPLALILFDRLAEIGVVQFPGKFNPDLRVAVDLPVAQQPVHQSPQAEQRPHGHRIANRRCARRTEPEDAGCIGLRLAVGLDHRGVIEPIESREVEPVVAEIVGDAALLGVVLVIKVPFVAKQQFGDVVFDLVPPLLVVVCLFGQYGLEVGQEDRFVIPVPETQVGQDLVDCIQAQCGVVLRQTDGGKSLRLLRRKLQLLQRPGAETLLVLEEKEGMPDIIQHLFLVLPLPEQIETAHFAKPVAAEHGDQRCRDGTSRHGRRAGEVEAIGGLGTLLPAGVFPLSGDLACDLLELEMGLAFPVEKRPDHFDLLLCQGARRCVLRRGDADVVDELQHAELLEARV